MGAMIQIGRRRALATLAAAATAAMADACGVNTASSGASGGGTASTNDSITVTAFSGAWGTDFETAFVKPFEKATGITVNLVYGADSTWLTKLRAADGSNPPFDLTALTSESVLTAVKGNLLQPLDTSKLTYWKQLDTVLVDQSVVDGKSYGVPLTTGSTGLMYRTDKIKTPPASWLDIFDKAYQGHVALPPLTYNTGLEFFSELVKIEGGMLSDTAAVNKAFTKLATLKGHVSAYPADASSITTDLENGDAWIVPFFDGRAFALQKEGQPIGFAYPNPNPVGALTSYYVPAGTTKTAAVYKFLNYLSAAAYQKTFAEATFYGAGNDSISYSAAFDSKIKHGSSVYEKFSWVDYSAATPNLDAWQQRWDQIFA
jgi:putative spermidine/putrescine transport system substrate-binding protein